MKDDRLEELAHRAFHAAHAPYNINRIMDVLRDTWNEAIAAAVWHCDDVRKDRAENPPAFPEGRRRKFSPSDVVMLERATAGSCKLRIETLRINFEPFKPPLDPTPQGPSLQEQVDDLKLFLRSAHREFCRSTCRPDQDIHTGACMGMRRVLGEEPTSPSAPKSDAAPPAGSGPGSD